MTKVENKSEQINESNTVYGSDLILSTMKECGIDYVAINPGSSIGGIQDSMVHNPEYPKMILCLHEEIAMAVAHGYSKASGKIMAVAVHASVGLLHSSMAIFNAWCDRSPILILGGSGPILVENRRPWIDWIHSTSNQAGLVANFVKWYDTPLSIPSCLDSIKRAVDISTYSPMAPVYIGLSSTLQESKVDDPSFIKTCVKNKKANAPTATQEDVAQLAKIVAGAKLAVIVVDYMDGRDGQADALVAFAEELGIGVLDLGGRYNFPSDHQLSLTGGEKDVICEADLVILIDVQDPHGALGYYDRLKRIYVSYIKSNTKVISLGMRDFLISTAIADYHKLVQFEHIIRADSVTTLNATLSYLKNNMTLDKQKHHERRLFFTSLREALKTTWRMESNANDHDSLNVPRALSAIWESVKNANFVLTNCGGLSIREWVKKLWEFDDANKSFVGINSGGAGLGYGLGASIGAAIAMKDKHSLCINIQNDGDLLYTPSALWTIAHYQLPMLIILMNNHSYALTKAVSKKVATDRQRQHPDLLTGNYFTNPLINYQSMAESYGIQCSVPIQTKRELANEISIAMAYVTANHAPYLIDLNIVE